MITVRHGDQSIPVEITRGRFKYTAQRAYVRSGIFSVIKEGGGALCRYDIEMALFSKGIIINSRREINLMLDENLLTKKRINTGKKTANVVYGLVEDAS